MSWYDTVTPVGVKNGMVMYVSNELFLQKGTRNINHLLGIVRRFPVTTDLSGRFVMVEADSQEDAIRRYLAHN